MKYNAYDKKGTIRDRDFNFITIVSLIDGGAFIHVFSHMKI